MGRLVITHSTYLEGLIEKLKKLADLELVDTVTPGRISRSKGRGGRLQIRISTEITGGYKLIARKGKTVQEVFLITKLEKNMLQIELNRLI